MCHCYETVAVVEAEGIFHGHLRWSGALFTRNTGLMWVGRSTSNQLTAVVHYRTHDKKTVELSVCGREQDYAVTPPRKNPSGNNLSKKMGYGSGSHQRVPRNVRRRRAEKENRPHADVKRGPHAPQGDLFRRQRAKSEVDECVQARSTLSSRCTERTERTAIVIASSLSSADRLRYMACNKRRSTKCLPKE